MKPLYLAFFLFLTSQASGVISHGPQERESNTTESAPRHTQRLFIDREHFDKYANNKTVFTPTSWRESDARTELNSFRFFNRDAPKKDLNKKTVEALPVIKFPNKDGKHSLIFFNSYPRTDQDKDNLMYLDLSEEPSIQTYEDLVKRMVPQIVYDKFLKDFIKHNEDFDFTKKIKDRDRIINITPLLPPLVYKNAFLFPEDWRYDTCNYLTRSMIFPFTRENTLSSHEYFPFLCRKENYSPLGHYYGEYIRDEEFKFKKELTSELQTGDILAVVRGDGSDHSAFYYPLNDTFTFETATDDMAEFVASPTHAVDSYFRSKEDEKEMRVDFFRPVKYEGAYLGRVDKIKSYLERLFQKIEN